MNDPVELGPDETHLAFAAMRVLRPHIEAVDEFVARVKAVVRRGKM